MILLVSGCASLLVSRPSGGQSAGGNMSSADARITNQINSALVREPGISSLDVYVSTHQGIVTLKGYVSSQRMKSRAGQIADSVAGVQSVRNQLRLR
jgi:hyperosmotically inducible protein